MISPTICSSCRTDLEPGERFCPECGKPVSANAPHSTQAPTVQIYPCPSCSEPVEIGDEWCASCGLRLSQAQIGNDSSANTDSSPASVSQFPDDTLLSPIGGAGAPPPIDRQSLQPMGGTIETADPSNAAPASPNGASTPPAATTARRGWNALFDCHTCGNCFAQDVKDAPTCHKCGARFLTPEEIAAIEAEEAKSDTDRAREKAQVALSGAAAKVTTTRQALNTAVEEQTERLASTRAGRSLKEYWVGWALVAAVMFMGIVVISFAVTSGKHRTATEMAKGATIVNSYAVNQPQRSQTYIPPQPAIATQWVSCSDCHGTTICPQCDPANSLISAILYGNGAKGRLRAGLCISCGGTGKKRTPNQFGILPDCTICRGTGQCSICGGSGKCQTYDGKGQLTTSNAAQLQQYRQQMQIQDQQSRLQTQQQYEWTRAN